MRRSVDEEILKCFSQDVALPVEGRYYAVPASPPEVAPCPLPYHWGEACDLGDPSFLSGDGAFQEVENSEDGMLALGVTPAATYG